MVELQPDGLTDQVGDKVRIKKGVHAGQRGLLLGVYNEELEIETLPGERVLVKRDVVTNYSLAARRAWHKMPKKAGRPKTDKPRKRMVSLRIDSKIWDDLGYAVAKGFVVSREQAVNDWLSERLDELLNADFSERN